MSRPRPKKMTTNEERHFFGIKRIQFLKEKGLAEEEIYQTFVDCFNFLRSHTYADVERLIDDVSTTEPK